MKCIHELFEAQVDRTPDATAVAFDESKITYRDLNHRADALAHQLRGLGVGPDTLVGLFFERSIDMVVAMLGVLKAGGAYVPLDPSYPSRRLAFMLNDARPPVLLTQQRLRSKLPTHHSQLLVIDAGAPVAASPDQVSAPRRPSGPRDLAYVIYTSGSTGDPKGVEIEHHSVVNMLASTRRRPGLDAGDTMLAITTLAFDIAVLEIFLPLSCGASVVIAPGETVVDGVALIALIERSGVTVIQATPATFRMLLEAGWAGAPHLKILCGGEAWTAELANRLLSCCGSLWNMYGPTETTVWSSVTKVEPGRPIVIGPPLANTRFYVLNGALQLVPAGVPGELHIGGEGLARGYLHQPELTRERFVVDPFSPEPGARMYRTGDRVRRLPDGTLEFIGRLDNQVKLRGYRIELGEIEARLREYPGLREAAVLARADEPGEQRLVAYFTGEDSIAAAALRGHLLSSLPEYMVPAACVRLDAMPLTLNGKLDRRALPAPGDAAFGTRLYAAAEGPVETTIAAIWAQHLRLERVGRHDGFFEVGGHSLLALRVIGEINKTLKVHLDVPAFFQQPTIAGLAGALRQTHQLGPEPRLVRLQPGNTGKPLYIIGAGPTEHRLARLIGEDRAIFAIDAPLPAEWHHAFTTGDRTVRPTIEEMGALYSGELRAHAGSSPCVIVGYSLFGKVAFEAAHALRRAGGNVALVLLIDARAFAWGGALHGPGWQSLKWIWRDATTRPSGDTSYSSRLSATLVNSWRLLRWLLARIPEEVKIRLLPADDLQRGRHLSGFFDKDGRPIGQAVIDRMARVAGRSWRPRPLDTAGVLFRAHFPGEDFLPGYDLANGWGDLFEQGLEIVQADGDHISMVVDENLAALARQINLVLDRCQAGQNTRAVAADGDARQCGVEQGLPHARPEIVYPPLTTQASR
jgi:amino acid adenylation domain-containing protein